MSELEILKQIKLLYIEDDAVIREILVKSLKRRVKQLEVATDGEDGLSKYKEFNPDIIVTDINMPKLCGLEMSKMIRQDNKEIPIIITSAHEEPEFLLDAIEHNISGYIIKPIDSIKLYELISTHAKAKVLEKKLKEKEKQLQLQSKSVALGELIENIAHQWRQPLSIISTTAGMIQVNNELGVDNQIESNEVLLERIINTSDNLSKTIDFLRDTYIQDNDKKVKVNFYSLVNDAVKLKQSKLDSLNIKVVYDIDSSLSLYNYSTLFLQTINIFISNCIDIFKESNQEEKLIFITVKKTKEELFLEVLDNAGGIDERVIDKVFDPYFTTKHQARGKGLGLHSAMIMVEDGLNGTLKASNKEFTYKTKNYKGASLKIKFNNH